MRLPNIEVTAVVYPKFETKGDLNGCVVRFREWLQNTVIDVEVANGTPSPTVDPSVHVFLIGHSMGGIVAAETLLLLASEQLLPTPSSISSSKTSEAEGNPVEANTFMFPHIQGLLAFDTPFLGIAPGVVSYTAENHYKTATAAYGAISEVAGVFGWGGAKTSENKTGNTPSTDGNTKSAASALTPATSTSNTSSSTDDAAATPSWQRWGRYAMYAGAAGAVAAGGAAALYSQRDKFLEGWSWATSHLEFVGCLARPEELRRRVSATAKLQQERGIGCADFYTCLGKGAVAAPANSSTSTSSPASSLSRSSVNSAPKSSASAIRLSSTPPDLNGIFWHHSSASSTSLVLITHQPLRAGFSRGPLTTVGSAVEENESRYPSREEGRRPSPLTMTPALTSSSLKVAMSANCSVVDIAPDSASASARTMTMKRGMAI
ncbi:conserved hypothetical protein [Histoplasma capsulatum H143]|uniref:DUF676 domain-containing protein n=1 Tax=Ajellomyces capsulatus (strain H143) TaxID=544712 RepID=C6HQF2_AJECH|nr:conserved hypothetical protein [Histoplasma capsulatum H143]